MIRFNNFNIGQLRGNGFNFKQMKLNGNSFFEFNYELQESDILSSININFTHQIEIAQVYDKYLLIVDGKDKKIYLAKLENDSLRLIESTALSSFTFSTYNFWTNKNSRYFAIKKASGYTNAEIVVFKINEDDTIEQKTLDVSSGYRVLFSENGNILTLYDSTNKKFYIYNIENDLTLIGSLTRNYISNNFYTLSKNGKYIFWHGLDSEKTNYFNLYRTDTLERIPVNVSSSLSIASSTIAYAKFSNDENKLAIVRNDSSSYLYFINIDETLETAETTGAISLLTNKSNWRLENLTFTDDDLFVGTSFFYDGNSTQYLCYTNTETLANTTKSISSNDCLHLCNDFTYYTRDGLYKCDLINNTFTLEYNFEKYIGIKGSSYIYNLYDMNLKKTLKFDDLVIGCINASTTVYSYVFNKGVLIHTFNQNSSSSGFYKIIKLGNYYFINYPYSINGTVYCLKNARV